MLLPGHATLVEAAAAIARGEYSSVELTRVCLERAARLNGALNCFVRIEDQAALAQAAAADAARAAGRALGPLHGVPVALKDMFHDPARATSFGSRLQRAPTSAAAATVVARLDAAGAVRLGALSMSEFALGPTGHNEFYGPCRNPWNTAYIAAGSSSGAGAATAARIAFAALGSDSGGSIRLPAAVCGVLGLKPTYARVSRAGAMPLSWSADHIGPLARTAADLARLLRVIAGHDPADPSSSHRAVPDYEARLGAGIGGLVVGVPQNFFFSGVDAELQCLIDAALAVLVARGARLTTVQLPEPERLADLCLTLLYSEAAALHGHALRTRGTEYSPQVRARIATGLAIPAAAYLEALLLRAPLLRSFVCAVYSSCDVLVTPTLAQPVPTLAATDVGAGTDMWATIGALVRCTAPFNYLGLPALSLPIGFSANGLPAGLQLVGRPFAEARLLAIAAAYQAETTWHQRAPALD